MDKRIGGINPYVIVVEDKIMGYADLHDNGYIDHFFVRGGTSGRGFGSHLMEHLITKAREKKIKELTSDVSLAAEGLYIKFGFEVVKRKVVNINGVELKNALMKKVIYD